jgi:hypothetical protein
VCGQYTTHEWGESGGVLPQKIFEKNNIAPKFMLTLLVFEINKGKNAQKVKKK